MGNMLVRSVIVFGYWILAIGYWRLDSRPQNAVQNYYIFLTLKNNFSKKISTTVDNFSKSVSITNSPASTPYTLLYTPAFCPALAHPCARFSPPLHSKLYTLHPTLPLGCLVHGGGPPCSPLLHPFVLCSRLPREFFYVHSPRGPR